MLSLLSFVLAVVRMITTAYDFMISHYDGADSYNATTAIPNYVNHPRLLVDASLRSLYAMLQVIVRRLFAASLHR